ncbi:MAG: RidA family protein [Hydrogenophaga sp.]|uniref:RidA family protein n=1 Tax=Hydrogenophaga sp. TaxID=1904254 RepID=UPI001DFE7FE0|nr:Rid family hydrolase [Hydrogenophaga sp.]MBX3608484.1 RidA family protein [Hydrogenophaga sp.]
MRTSTAAPMARYAAARRVGDHLYLSGIVAVDAASGGVLQRYDALPSAAREALRTKGYDTGQLSVDVFESPIVVQSWVVLERIRQLVEDHGGDLANVCRLVQYFTDLRDYPAYNRVRDLFFAEPVVSTVVQVSGMLPGEGVRLEVEATVWLPPTR